jgi:hypothetical protein
MQRFHNQSGTQFCAHLAMNATTAPITHHGNGTRFSYAPAIRILVILAHSQMLSPND